MMDTLFGEAVLERLILGGCGERDRDRMGVAVTLEGKIIEVLSHIADHIQKTSLQALGRHNACLRRREIGASSPEPLLKLIINLVWLYVLVIPCWGSRDKWIPWGSLGLISQPASLDNSESCKPVRDPFSNNNKINTDGV